MAKNYTMKEACEIIAAGEDLEAIFDIGRRFPVLAHKLAVATAKAGDEVVDLMNYMPEYLTANKVNSQIKKAMGGTTSEGETEQDTAEETEGETETAAAEWNENMTGKQLWDILGKAGKRKLANSTKKADLIEACKKAFGEGTAEEAKEAEEAEEQTEGAYAGKSAMDLFKECKKRGIKAPAKKTAKYYADLLEKDDAKAENTDADDDWDDEPEEKAEKPAKKAAKAEADDDDDWDI